MRMPDRSDVSTNDLSSRYCLHPDNDWQEVVSEDLDDEAAITELVPEFKDAYFDIVQKAFIARLPLGRMRILPKGFIIVILGNLIQSQAAYPYHY